MRRTSFYASSLFLIAAMLGTADAKSPNSIQVTTPSESAPAPAPSVPVNNAQNAVPPAPPVVELPVADTRPAINISQAKVYIYNFLDIREDYYQKKVLDEFEKQLTAWLTPRVQALTIIRSNRTPYVVKRDDSDWQADLSAERSVDRVPVARILASNEKAEEEFGADHQLIIFPSSFTLSGVWRFYTIRFVVIRKSDKKAWQYLYDGSHMVMLRESERSKSRAEKVLVKLDAAMLSGGLITGPALKKATEASESTR